MLIRFGLGGQLSGSVGGVVAGHNKGGQYLRNRSIPVNPNSTRQQAQRNGFGAAAISWRSLTAGQRAAWESYASLTPVINRLGESITVSGFNMYQRTNAFLLGVGLAAITAAPPTPGLSSLGTPATPAFIASVANGLSFGTVGADATGATYGIAQYGPPLSPGVNFYRGPYSLFASGITFVSTGFATEPQTVTPGRYGALVAGEIRPIRVRSMDADGRISNTVEGIVTVVA
jgi:hypothetical protein